MYLKLLIIGVPICAVFIGSAFVFARERATWSLLQLFGAGCLVVVELTHVAEAFHLLPWMKWGFPSSAGHYVDLLSAVFGLILFPVGYVSRRLAKRRIPN
jgi:formate hydrogenlyase subunit 3/multisubunit Na+/H+ antiporter MnhD subunit